MSGRVLVLGANGFIGANVAAALAEAGWSVRAGARRPDEARRRAPAHDWVRADFAELVRPDAWTPLLDGVDAVVNCVGVLQDGGEDSTRVAHVEGPRALIAACEAKGIRLIHISAVGADEAAGTAYGRSKAETESLLKASSADWLALRPSLVIARPVFGGTGLIRALAAMSCVIPVIGGDQMFRPIAMDDLAAAVVAGLKPGAPSREVLDVAGPERLTLVDILKAYRGWLGLAPAPVVRVPRWAAAPVLWLGDLAGRLGWPSPLRTTALRQMDHDVEGDAEIWTRRLNVAPQGLTQWLSRHPASVQDVWHARLWAVRPVAIILLAGFWIATGVITLGPGWNIALAVLEGGGYGEASPWVAGIGAWFDIVVGLALLVRRWTARVALLMAASTLGYLAAATLTLPEYWIDPLGPWTKVFPMMALCLFIAATEARR